ncbi:MAG TPA: type II toxin-antitoxin system VapC family toxin [Kofleriaceae bacterium]|jgi:PIN domain nuclease of toxin-antitoxin system
MRYLLDTHAVLWWSVGDRRVPKKVRSFFGNPEHELFLSSASVWETAIKMNLRKLDLSMTLPQLVEGAVLRGVRLLDVRVDHTYLVETLPMHHRDPFDRILVAQAAHEGLSIVSVDEKFDAYKVKRVWA